MGVESSVCKDGRSGCRIEFLIVSPVTLPYSEDGLPYDFITPRPLVAPITDQ